MEGPSKFPVTLLPIDKDQDWIVDYSSKSVRDVTIGNLTMKATYEFDGSTTSGLGGVVFGSWTNPTYYGCRELTIGNCVFDGFQDAVKIGRVGWDGLFGASIVNNTFTNVENGVLIKSVHEVDQARPLGLVGSGNKPENGERFYAYSAIENNLFDGVSGVALLVGNGSDSAAAWSPYGDPFEDPGTPLGNQHFVITYNAFWDVQQKHDGDFWLGSRYVGNDDFGSIDDVDPDLGADYEVRSSQFLNRANPEKLDASWDPNTGWVTRRRSHGAVQP